MAVGKRISADVRPERDTVAMHGARGKTAFSRSGWLAFLPSAAPPVARALRVDGLAGARVVGGQACCAFGWTRRSVGPP